MRSRLLPVLAAGALSLSLLGPVSARAADPDVSLPDAPVEALEPAAEHASDVLDQALELQEERSPAAARRLIAEGGLDATMRLNELARVRGDLSPSDRVRADRLFARPTDQDGDGTADYGDAPHTAECNDTICIHYVTDPDDPNAPDLTDGDDEGTVPDSVELALATAQSVHDTFVGAGYLRPDGDGTKGENGTDLVDIYLAELGQQSIYGYCTVDDFSGRPPFHRAAYCGIDNDFLEFPGDPLETMQVTLAHEYFHAVQFAYDFFEDSWVMEATATWAEDELYDDVDDNRQYLPASQLVAPWSPLDRWSSNVNFQYGNWIFFRYLTERWPAASGGMPTLVRDLWRQMGTRSGQPDLYSTQAVQKLLARRGTDFTTVYGQFADANRRPSQTYAEGAEGDYPVVRPALNRKLSKARRSIQRAAELDHLTSLPLRFRPAANLRQRSWKLRLAVDMPGRATQPVARVAVYRKGGKVSTGTIRLNPKGKGSRALAFSSRNVRYVELVLVNASRRVRLCQSDFTGPDYYACFGSPRDNRQRSVFKASTFRR